MNNPNFKGPIAWMANNPVSANLLMAVLLIGGILSLFTTNQEIFPEFDLDIVTVSVPYPGASPLEVEQGIIKLIEEEVRGLDGVKRVTSVSQEGIGIVTVELLLGVDANKVLADVKNAVDGIPNFPEDAEKPRVSLAVNKRQVYSLIIAGDQDFRELHDLAEKIRFDLLQKDNITQVEIDGVPPLEISIEIPQQTLRQYGLSLTQIAHLISSTSMEIPAGGIKAQSGEILIRMNERRLYGKQFEDIIVASSPNGSKVRLRDIATIRDDYQETDQASYYNGKRAIRIQAYRVGDETPKGVADTVRKYQETLQDKIPANITVATWNDRSQILHARINLLIKNALMGLVLVVLLLSLILNLRLAFWVSLGIPISFMGAFFLMPTFDVTINMLSLFAFIVTLGMVVDDAIVVGENVYHHLEAGKSKMEAAILGAKEMAVPVSFSILTSIAAFAPLLFVPGIMGKIFKIIPIIVISVLVISLIESFFVLPAHLAHSKNQTTSNPEHPNYFQRIQTKVTNGLQSFITKYYTPFLKKTLSVKYITIAAALALLIIVFGATAQGLVSYRYFPNLEGDLVRVTARLPYGSPFDRTQSTHDLIKQGLDKTIQELQAQDKILGVYSRLGETAVRRGHSISESVGSHLVSIELYLVGSDMRAFSSEVFAQTWRKNLPAIAGLESLLFSSSVGPSGGAPVDLAISHRDVSILQKASVELTNILKEYKELVDVENSFSQGKPQLSFTLKPLARTYGLTVQDIAQQIRGSYYGLETSREQRGRNEIKIMVRLPKAERSTQHSIEEMLVATSQGKFIPLHEVADFTRGTSPTEIKREDGRRLLNISAELAKGIKSSRPIIESLQNDVLPALREKYPDLLVEFAGSKRESNESMQALGQNFILALILMFALLAIPFKSYSQPLIIMSAIPFGFVGAIIGHVVMGYSLSIFSAFGIVALSGVVVNDSLVLIDAINNFRREGYAIHDAIIRGCQRRFRPILLTSLTTFLGLAPMILETSIQAKFMIPMAISLGFGVLFGTFIILLLIPSLYLIHNNIITSK